MASNIVWELLGVSSDFLASSSSDNIAKTSSPSSSALVDSSSSPVVVQDSDEIKSCGPGFGFAVFVLASMGMVAAMYFELYVRISMINNSKTNEIRSRRKKRELEMSGGGEILVVVRYTTNRHWIKRGFGRQRVQLHAQSIACVYRLCDARMQCVPVLYRLMLPNAFLFNLRNVSGSSFGDGRRRHSRTKQTLSITPLLVG